MLDLFQPSVPPRFPRPSVVCKEGRIRRPKPKLSPEQQEKRTLELRAEQAKRYRLRKKNDLP